jgi:hypothetical protein
MKTIREYKIAYTLTDVIHPSDEKEAFIYDLIHESANDKNSSSFREAVTKWMMGLEVSNTKLGYDDDYEAIEVKPVNYTGAKKLQGSGNFSDLTWARHTKYIQDNVRMIISGFCAGKLLYIIEFNYSEIQDKLEKQLLVKLPNGDEKNKYVRSASFTHTDWAHKQYKILYVRPNIATYSHAINKVFYKLLAHNSNAHQFFKCTE